MVKRGLSEKPEYIERLKEELGVIKAMKNSDYFISYQKIMELAREVCLVGPARGSGGGSLVAYCLYITDLDPLKWDLPFARFLSVYRKGAPDIDTDLANRDKVLEQLRNFFGFENVVPISNYNTFKLKTLVKDIGKFYGVPFEETNAATRSVEQEVRKATTKHGDDKNLFVLTFDEAMAFHCKYQPPEEKPICQGCHDECKEKPVSASFRSFIETYPVVAEAIKILFKQNRSLGRHAGGVLIADDLPNKMPLVTSKGKGDEREPQSPWVEGVNYKHLEKIGEFIKYDLLGLETMRLIERSIELILIKEGNPNPTFADVKAWFEQHMHPSVIDFDDPRPYEVYSQARWAGIFQLTSTGAQRLFVKAKPKSIIDIATLTSIYRPGPLAANVDKLYLEAKNEGKQLEWGDHRINDILKKTYSCLTGDAKVMTDQGEVTIKEIVDNQMIGITLPSYNEETGELEQDAIVAAVCNGVKEVIELDTDMGVIKLTADHLVMTQRGWVEAGQLTLEDEILSIKDYTYLSGAMLEDEQGEEVSDVRKDVHVKK
jgi:DNA polymerase-3 subunit alpha